MNLNLCCATKESLHFQKSSLCNEEQRTTIHFCEQSKTNQTTLKKYKKKWKAESFLKNNAAFTSEARRQVHRGGRTTRAAQTPAQEGSCTGPHTGPLGCAPALL